MRIRGSIWFLAGILAALGAGWIGFPRAIYKTQPQPVDFSHKIHAEKAGLQCEDCHAFRGDGTYAGIPTLDKCAGCHTAPMGTTQAEKNFIDQYVTPNREPQWASNARQPENVYFPHAAHVKLAKLECKRCHGGQGASDKLRPRLEDRINGYSRDILPVESVFPSRRGQGSAAPRMKMDDCVACHRQHGLEHSCLDCHK
ncbi:MAG: menaquinone reductase multiheme cytochrome c subunit QrcA [Bryobacteraceae bacterium]